MSSPKPTFDRRLLGTWRSDRRRTFRHFKPKPGAAPESLRKLRSLFGKLVIHWERGRYSTELDGHRDAGEYEVIASDAKSVVVCCRDPRTDRETLQQIHFDGDYYWIALDGRLIEWFRRVG